LVVSTCDLHARIARWQQQEPAGEGRTEAGGPARYERPAVATEFVAPESEIEKALAALWQELLGLNRVGIQDDFFELGGHSLLATQLLAKIQQTFPVELDFHDLVDHPTIGSIAETIEERLIDKLAALSDAEAAALMADVSS